MNKILLILLLLMNIFDVYATQYAMTYGIKEANPLMDYVIQDYGIVTVLCIKIGLILPLLFVKIDNRFISCLLIFVTGVYVWVTMLHLGFLFRI